MTGLPSSPGLHSVDVNSNGKGLSCLHTELETKPEITSADTVGHYQAFAGFDVGEVNQLEVGRLRNQWVR